MDSCHLIVLEFKHITKVVKLFSATALVNGQDGVQISDGAHANQIGDTVQGNFLNGIHLLTGAYFNTVNNSQVNRNQQSGIMLEGLNTSFNLISGTQIFSNTLDGIGERFSATTNTWTQVSIYNNGGLGIDKNAASDLTNLIDTPVPVVRSYNTTTGVVTGTASALALVELYRGGPDGSGYGEGRTFVGSTAANGTGVWSITLGAGQSPCFTAFQTVGALFIFSSSEFGPNTCRNFLPVVTR
jgi:hypothetical protein